MKSLNYFKVLVFLVELGLLSNQNQEKIIQHIVVSTTIS